MTHDPETKKAAIRMFMDGHKPQDIGEELGVKTPTVYTWTKGLKVQKEPRKKESEFNLEAALERLTEEELYSLVNDQELGFHAADMKEWRTRINSILAARGRPDPEEQRKRNLKLLWKAYMRKYEARRGPIFGPKPSEEPKQKPEIETIAPFWESDEDDEDGDTDEE